MRFNQYAFLLLLLPVALLGYHLLSRVGRRGGVVWLTVISLAGYAWCGWDLLALLVGSAAVNLVLARFHAPRPGRPGGGWPGWLILAVIFDLGLLAWCKYGGILTGLVGADGSPAPLALPLGISFYTFQQISFQVDAWRGRAGDLDALDYLLYLTFFPRVVNGPIVRHQSFVAQLPALPRGLRADDLAGGLSLLAIGLGKQAVIATALAVPADAVFGMVHRLNDPATHLAAVIAGDRYPSLFAAWGGTLAYAAQIYFDFSGYSDMALGLARCFGLRLPLNFLSPYKARSIGEFWRRWHISLSQFLRDYLYIPLGGNRGARWRTHANLFATMLLGGLWHGAGWGFAVWGALHGVYLMIHHAWRGCALAQAWRGCGWWGRGAQALTFLAVSIAWVLFRSPTLTDAASMLRGLVGLNGVELSPRRAGALGGLRALGVGFTGTDPFPGNGFGLLALVFALIWVAPAAPQLFRAAVPCLEPLPFGTRWSWRWRPHPGWALAVAIILLTSLLRLDGLVGFLYDVF
jgi:D-alanyl-lipoteichoic acid acyltransferase DltB (MBOAT superfamily)